MAMFSMKGLEDTIDQMRKMGEDTGPTADKMIMAGAEEVKKAWQYVAESRRHKKSGDMIESVGYAKTPERASSALWIDIYPQGDDSRGVRNAMKAFKIHYGTSKKPGDHWVDEANYYAEITAVPAMKKIWDEYIASKQKG